MHTRRFFFLYVILVLSFVVIFVRLFQLQVLQGKENRILAENNRVKKNIIEPPRGLILERHGGILVGNQAQYYLQIPDGKKKTISRQQALDLQAKKEDASLKIDFKRVYPTGDNFAHLLGYLGEVSEDELTSEKLDLKGYSVGSFIGRAGVEAFYEKLLRGREGSELLEVDTSGVPVRKIGLIAAQAGKDLTLSVDRKLQEVAVKEMKNRKGAVIATNPNNGEVLLLYSSPSFDPNVFLDSDKTSDLAKIINDEENQPLLNRVISGLYPPGSTFKIVTSIAGLQEGKITSTTLIEDPGVIVLGQYRFANWYYTSYGATESEVNLKKAIARSVDTYFYKVGEWLGIDNLAKWAGEFNLDEQFGIDLPGEIPGFIATPEWKKKVKGEDWFLGNTYHIAIGQGDLIFTPLGVNMMTSVIASGGKICKPRVLRIGSENTPYSGECRDLPIKKEYLEAVKEGMVAACSPGGTAGSFSLLKYQSACKTGTAETGDGKTSHGWFTVFAPACAEALTDKSVGKPNCQPEIVVTVLLEKGGEGSSVAAPVAKEILKEYFREMDQG